MTTKKQVFYAVFDAFGKQVTALTLKRERAKEMQKHIEESGLLTTLACPYFKIKIVRS